MRKLFGAAIATLVLVTAGGAAAAQKQRVVVDRFSDTYSDAVDCADFGPYAFTNLFEGRQRVTVTEVLDGEGNLLQIVFHTTIQETQTNSESEATLPLKGAVHEVWDFASNTRTLSGKVWLGTAPGAGTYVQDTGRITMDLDTRVPSFEAGPHEAFYAGLDFLVCAALAEA
jgi:hypothetical protein